MTIKEAQLTVDQWIKEHGVRYFNELTNMACLTEEVGELARVIARTYGVWRTKFQAWRKAQLGGRDGRRALGIALPGQPNGHRLDGRAAQKPREEDKARRAETSRQSQIESL